MIDTKLESSSGIPLNLNKGMFQQATGMFIAETHTDAVTWFFTVDKMLVSES